MHEAMPLKFPHAHNIPDCSRCQPHLHVSHVACMWPQVRDELSALDAKHARPAQLLQQQAKHAVRRALCAWECVHAWVGEHYRSGTALLLQTLDITAITLRSGKPRIIKPTLGLGSGSGSSRATHAGREPRLAGAGSSDTTWEEASASDAAAQSMHSHRMLAGSAADDTADTAAVAVASAGRPAGPVPKQLSGMQHGQPAGQGAGHAAHSGGSSSSSSHRHSSSSIGRSSSTSSISSGLLHVQAVGKAGQVHGGVDLPVLPHPCMHEGERLSLELRVLRARALGVCNVTP